MHIWGCLEYSLHYKPWEASLNMCYDKVSKFIFLKIKKVGKKINEISNVVNCHLTFLSID